MGEQQANNHSFLGQLIRWPLLAAGGWIAYSHLFIDHDQFLPNAIQDADQAYFESRDAGQLSYYYDRSNEGRPLLLIHSVNAAASAYEMRPLFNHYRDHRPVYGLDLPGFGYSNREPRAYSPALYAAAILDMLGEIGEPADVIALSLGCEFVARAVLHQSDAFHSLTFISPTGFNQIDKGRTSQRANMRGRSDWLHRLFSFPLWARPFFDLIATRRSINYFLKQSFYGPIPPGFVDHAYATAHQPGAEHAPLRFVTGQLFTRNASGVLYENVLVPTLVLYDQDAFSRFDTLLDVLAVNAQWQAHHLTPSWGMPHFEKPEETWMTIDTFWAVQEAS